MNNFDAVAEKYQEHEGHTLVDYLPIALPCFLLQVDSIVIEKKKITPVVEFLLKAVQIGIDKKAEVLGFLGLSEQYGNWLLRELDNDEFISFVDDNLIKIRPKGIEILRLEGEIKPVEKNISVTWDSVENHSIPGYSDLVGLSIIKA
jgi:hypothetical protein